MRETTIRFSPNFLNQLMAPQFNAQGWSVELVSNTLHEPEPAADTLPGSDFIRKIQRRLKIGTLEGDIGGTAGA